MKKVYYAHSMHLYNTVQEERDTDTLFDMGFEVLNPSQEEYQRGFEKHNQENPNREDYMDYFKYRVLECDVLAFRAHVDGTIPSGVGYEIKVAQEYGKVIIELPNFISKRFLSLEDTRSYLQYLGNR